MEVVPLYIKVLTYSFVIAYMFSVGMGTTSGQIKSVLRDSKLTVPALLANWVLVPIVGVILTSFIAVPPDIKIGLLLLAVAPGGLFALNFARVSGSNINLAVALLLLLSITSIVITPLLAHFIFGSAAEFGSIFRIMIKLFLLVLVPLYAGRLTASLFSQPVALKMARLIGIASIVLFITVTLLSSSIKSPAMKLIGTGGLGIIIFLVVSSWIIGWFLGGPDVHNKIVMALSTSLRNVGVCMPLAIHQFSSENVVVALLAFSGISIPMNFLFSTVMKFVFKHRKEAVVPKV